MRELIDRDILKWNGLLESSNLKLQFYKWIDIKLEKGQNRTSQSIKINKFTSHNEMYHYTEIDDPTIRYDYSFSIQEEIIDDFHKIFNLLLSNGIVNSKSLLSVDNKEDSYKRIFPIDSKFESIIQSTFNHKVGNRNYVLYKLILNDKLTSIISYLTLLEDTLSFLKELYKEEDGLLVKKPKFKVGTIVSLSKDKSSNLLITDYEYFFDVYVNTYYIKYKVNQIDNEELTHIKYGDSYILNETDLTWNRDERLDSILF